MMKSKENSTNKFPDPGEYNFRPVVKKFAELVDLANQVQSSPTKLVNFFAEVGIEVFKRSLNEFEKEFRERINKTIKEKK